MAPHALSTWRSPLARRGLLAVRAARMKAAVLVAASLWTSRLRAQTAAPPHPPTVAPRPRAVASPSRARPTAPPPATQPRALGDQLVGVLYAVTRVNGHPLPFRLSGGDQLDAAHVLFESPTTFSRGAVGTGPRLQRAARLLRVAHPTDKAGRTIVGLTGTVVATGPHAARLVFDIGRVGYTLEAPEGLRWQRTLRIRLTADGQRYDMHLERLSRVAPR